MKESIVGKFSSKSRERQPVVQAEAPVVAPKVLSDENVSSSQITHPNDSTFSFEQLKQSNMELKVSSADLDQSVSSTNKVEISIKSDRKTTGCQSDAGQFGVIDLRSCLRCGLNDKQAPQVCRYHPARPKNPLASAEKYSTEFHLCLERCKQGDQGCKRLKQHYFGTHLSYQP